MGPVTRKHWRREHRYFRTNEYANISELEWNRSRPLDHPLEKWRQLPRGDKKHHTLVSQAVAQSYIVVLEELFSKAIDQMIVQARADQSPEGVRLVASLETHAEVHKKRRQTHGQQIERALLKDHDHSDAHLREFADQLHQDMEHEVSWLSSVAFVGGRLRCGHLPFNDGALAPVPGI